MRTVLQWLFLASVGTTVTVTVPMSLTPPPAPGDSGDTGDSGTTNATGDTGAIDDSGASVDTADSGGVPQVPVVEDSGDSAELDTADPLSYSAAQRAGEKGEFGCASVHQGMAGLTWVAGFALVAIRRRRD